jgi:small-conductance mechanosensitive channel
MVNWIGDRLSNLWDWFTDIGLHLLWAALIIVLILIGSRWLRRRLNRGLRSRHVNPNAVNLINIFSKMLVYSFVIIVLLRVFGVDSSSLATTVGIVAGAITLSLQDVIKNLVSGIYLLIEQPFRVGDRIEVSLQKGIVERVDIRTTVLLNEFDEHVLVPNYLVFSQIVLNRSSKVDAPEHFTIEGVTAQPSEMRRIFDEVAANLEVAKPPKLEIVQAGPYHFVYEISIWWKPGDTDRFALVSCLRERFPDAMIKRVTS